MPQYSLENHIGEKHNRLLIIGIIQCKKEREMLCKCDCGKTTHAPYYRIIKGEKKSCGCYKTEHSKELYSGYRSKNPKLYGVWNSMRQRCNNPNVDAYKYYGNRGIKVCDEWRYFESFYKWAYDNGYKPGLTIERIDYNKNYCPENCCWIPKQKQSLNKRNVKLYTINGESKPLPEWCRIYNIDYHLVRQRIFVHHFDLIRALTQPKQIQNHHYNDVAC